MDQFQMECELLKLKNEIETLKSFKEGASPSSAEDRFNKILERWFNGLSKRTEKLEKRTEELADSVGRLAELVSDLQDSLLFNSGEDEDEDEEEMMPMMYRSQESAERDAYDLLVAVDIMSKAVARKEESYQLDCKGAGCTKSVLFQVDDTNKDGNFDAAKSQKGVAEMVKILLKMNEPWGVVFGGDTPVIVPHVLCSACMKKSSATSSGILDPNVDGLPDLDKAGNEALASGAETLPSSSHSDTYFKDVSP